jgi:hypothetical protein
MYKQVHAYTQKQVHAYIYTYIYNHMHTHTNTNAYIQAKKDIDILMTVNHDDPEFRRLLADWHKKKDAHKVKEMKAFRKMFE